MVQEAIETLRPTLHLCESYDEAAEAADQLDTQFRAKLGEPRLGVVHFLQEHGGWFDPRGFVLEEFCARFYVLEEFCPTGFCPRRFVLEGFYPREVLSQGVCPTGVLSPRFCRGGVMYVYRNQ